MSVLITGGTGKTGRRLARLLEQAAVPFRVASRHPDMKAAREILFDWTRAETWPAALEGTQALYLVAPPVGADMLQTIQPFLTQALQTGVRRAVLLSASSLPAGGPYMGEVHQWLADHMPEWTVLRPTWFMQNFSEQQHLDTLLCEDSIYSATGTGRVPFIDAEDIAAAACAALTGPARNADVILTGPQTLSYDDVAHVLSVTTGRIIRHVSLSPSALAERFTRSGMPQEYAQALAAMDSAISEGAEDRVTEGVMSMTGRAPGDFSRFARRHRETWRKPS
ncbi:ergot alkaloid biosynthesis protein [Cronobacter muytjensii]|uniref:ergot alkaloid biosynthesis protein n=1 Tax=Cronobacter muytjensii TaxID=413501 RepID=UPI002A139EB2|nr:ergot alkaloid biosynthesis protein [Cronobacter muytjensii]ELY6276893.1 ergot alkaloid biosynthesis protein [Cronobacter muytjensii]MEB8641765.1 ergot alkaloid biosynthesis protein [Cronobacter muytjensii]